MAVNLCSQCEECFLNHPTRGCTHFPAPCIVNGVCRSAFVMKK